ncbi:MAG: barstar family protein [Proteobacteria bacterium]|nr:barstar family protein [Pseudomonadota bacterium]
MNLDLGDFARNGAHIVDPSDLDELDAAAHEQGLVVRRISLAGCSGKHDLLRRIAAALAFPQTFGANWDALADCLDDLSWLPQGIGYAWLFDHAEDLRAASENDFDTLRDILDEACKRWQDRDTSCFAFLAMPDEAFGG